MADRLIKIQSEQGALDVTGKKNNLDFILRGGQGKVNLAKSYVALNMQVDLNSTDIVGSGMFNGFFTFNGNGVANNSGVYPSNVVLVKNASAYSQGKGKLEDLRRVDRLKGNLAFYDKSHAEALSSIDKLSANRQDSTYAPQPVDELVTLGDVLSRKRDHEVRIPLKEIFNFCNNESYDTDVHQDTRFRLEMNFNLLGIGIETVNDFATLLLHGVAGQEFKNMQPQGAVGAGNSDFVLTTNEYVEMQDSPFFTGQIFKVNSNKDAAGLADSANVILTKIEKDTDNGTDRLKLSFNTVWSTGAGAYATITLKLQNANAGSDGIIINKAEMVAEVVDDAEPAAPLIYTTYLALEDSYAAVASSTRNYEIPPMTKNIYVVLNETIISQGNLDEYRISIDNRDYTNRAIRINSPLDYDLKSAVYQNNGGLVKNFESFQVNVFSTKQRTNNGNDGRQIKMIMCPVPFKNVPQVLNLELSVGAGTLHGSHTVYMEQMVQKM